jgi:hypothetical protein
MAGIISHQFTTDPEKARQSITFDRCILAVQSNSSSIVRRKNMFLRRCLFEHFYAALSEHVPTAHFWRSFPCPDPAHTLTHASYIV